MPDLSTWRKALAGEPVPLHENDPQPGYWRLRQGRGGPFLPVAIWCEPDGSSEGPARRGAGRRPAALDLVLPQPCRLRDLCGGRRARRGLAGRGSGRSRPQQPGGRSRRRHAGGDPEPAADRRRLAGGGQPAQPAGGSRPGRELRRALRPAWSGRPRRPAAWPSGRCWRRAGPSTRPGGRRSRRPRTGKKRMKKALEPYLLAEQQRLAALAGEDGELPSPALSPRAGTLGRRVGLRTRAPAAGARPRRR